MTLATDVNLYTNVGAYYTVGVVQLWSKLCKNMQFMASGVLY
jgi:hypothetical protein